MSKRLATRIGLLVPDERPADARDAIRFCEPTVGALARTKGSLFLLAQLSGGSAALEKEARAVLEKLEQDYYYDLSAGALGALSKALIDANRRLFHLRRKLQIPKRAGVSVIAVVIRGREAHIAKLGPAAAVILRDGRMFELPPPPPVSEEDPRVRQRRVAASLGEALEIEPYTWHGELSAMDRVALVSRNLAHVVGVEELKRALETMRPADAVEHLQHLFAVRGGRGSDGLLAIELVELPVTVTTRQLEAVRAPEPLAGLPDQSPVPLADALGRFLHRCGAAIDAGQAALGRFLLLLLSWVMAFVPKRPTHYPKAVVRTALREEGRRHRRGAVGIMAVAGLLALGGVVASLPNPRPSDAIPRASLAHAAIATSQELVAKVAEKVDGRSLIDRDPARAREALNDAVVALAQANAAGVSASDLAPYRLQVERGIDTIYNVTRIGEVSTLVDLGRAFEGFVPERMVAASDGSLWVADSGHGRVVRIDPVKGSAKVVYRAGQALDDGTAGDPWLLATAATDVVVVDRQRQAWRIDLDEQVPHGMALAGIDQLDAASSMLAGLQHRPPLLIFNLYAVNAKGGVVLKWTPRNTLPVSFPTKPESYLSSAPDLSVASATDLRVDTHLWLLHSDTVTRVNFGTPLAQSDYSLDRPPDGELRPRLDYRLLDGATVGQQDYLYVWDAANARIVAFGYADGSFVRQWQAPSSGPNAHLLDRVIGLEVASTPDGPPAAYLLTPTGVVRVVLE
jgi:sugar lactone lactonase YvrE